MKLTKSPHNEILHFLIFILKISWISCTWRSQYWYENLFQYCIPVQYQYCDLKKIYILLVYYSIVVSIVIGIVEMLLLVLSITDTSSWVDQFLKQLFLCRCIIILTLFITDICLGKSGNKDDIPVMILSMVQQNRTQFKTFHNRTINVIITFCYLVEL